MAGEKNLQGYFRKQAKCSGVLWYKMKAEGVNGFPDVMLVCRGRIIFVELKNPNGRGVLHPAQLLRHAELARHGADVRTLKTKDEIDEIIIEITR